MILSDERLTELLKKIDYFNRNKISDYEYVKELNYIDPNGYLEKLDNNIDHVVFGRRGSGKTTLLQKSIDRKLDKDICILSDCESLKDDTQITILIKLIQKTLKGMLNNINELEYLTMKKKYKHQCKGLTSIFYKIFKIDTIKDTYENLNYIYIMLNFFNNSLYELLEMENEIEIKVNEEFEKINIRKNSTSLKAQLNAEAKLKTNIEFRNIIRDFCLTINSTVDSSYNYTHTNNNKKVSKQSYAYVKKIKKEELLLNLKEPLVDLFNRYTKYYNKKIILFLDDFYYINKNSQPFIIKYIHQLNKLCTNNSFSFKLCSLPNRFKLNNDDEYDLSIEDDFSPIDIDRELFDLEEIKDFLLDIICAISNEDITPNDFKTLFKPRKEIYYFISACGGNPRDFMNFLDLVIREGRKNNKKNITRRLIYYASHKSQTRKENSIEDDSILDKDIILQSLNLLKTDFIENKKTNIFLYPIDLNEKHDKLLKSLLNLGYIHILKENIVSDYHGKKTYVPYLVDMSLYVTSQSMKKNMEFREYWEKDNSSRLTNITSAPTWVFPENLIS